MSLIRPADQNLLALTLLSAGTPMLLMGDEVRRTQQGNNNAYCLDSKVSWFDWDLCKANAKIFRFVQELIRLRLHFDHGTSGDAIPLEDDIRDAYQVAWNRTRQARLGERFTLNRHSFP